MTSTHPPTAPSDPEGPAFRSSAVARIAGMPVATLRIWEQRYRAVHPATGPSGHRLYSAADVQRVLLLRHLAEQGHAIGSIAALETARLQDLAQATRRGSGVDLWPAHATVTLRLAVVGMAFATRLQRPASAPPGKPVARVVAVFASLGDAAAAAGGTRADVLLWHVPELRAEVPAALRVAQQACGARQVAVVYRFASRPALQAVAATGAVVVREPADDPGLLAWLASLAAGHGARPAEARGASAAGPDAVAPPAEDLAPLPPTPRRFDDTTLMEIAGLSPTLACECPRHVAELLMQLASFERYSAGCIRRDDADARLHAHLQQVAGAARMLFESALERVARHEGLPLR